MANFLPVFIATLQFILGVYIFKSPQLSGGGPLMSSMMVLLSLALILWHLPLYPVRLRELTCWAHYIAEYLIAVFIIELLMAYFWFPLEATVLAFLPKIADAIENSLMWIDSACRIPCDSFDFLRKESAGMFMSYLLSLFILLSALHATRLINLKLLTGRKGVSSFFKDISRRFRRFLKSCNVDIGFGSRSTRSRTRRPDYCGSDDEDFDFEDDQIDDEGNDECRSCGGQLY